MVVCAVVISRHCTVAIVGGRIIVVSSSKSIIDVGISRAICGISRADCGISRADCGISRGDCGISRGDCGRMG